MLTRQQYMNKECTYQEYYGQFVTEHIKRSILTVFTPAELKGSTDPHMNDLPRAKWDLLVNSTQSSRLEQAQGTKATQSDINSLIKEAARQLQAELRNQPKKVPSMSGILQALQATSEGIITKDNLLFRKQKYTTPWRTKGKEKCRAFIRFDDECGNRHNTFAITGETRDFYDGRWHEGSCGCVHEAVEKFFPELAPFIKWHSTSSDGPMHYIANTVYHAGDKDCHGLRKGEKRQIVNGRTGEPCWHLAAFDAEGNEIELHRLPKETEGACPTTQYTVKWVPWCRIGEGKERELDAARNSAVWPDATDEELCAPDLKEKLEARHAQLMAEFKSAIECLGLLWQPERAPQNEN